MEGGIPAVLLYEDLEYLSPYMHSAMDILGVSLNDAPHFEANARLAAAAVADLAGPFAAAADLTFLRQDANADGTRDLSDSVFLLSFLFLGGPAPYCADAADANDDGQVDIADPIDLLTRLFKGSDPIPEPAGSCGMDPTADPLGCFAYPPCAGP